jgi:ATP-dependent exoDNAse (exonuclease V) beta subunit
MTIHKAKGLEFPIVILPQLDYYLQFMSNSKFLIDAGEQMIYKNLSLSSGIIPVRLFAEEEKELILTDKMNLFYVAMTRPENRLYAFNHFSKNNFGALIHKSLLAIAEDPEDTSPLIIERGNENEKKAAGIPKVDTFYCPSENTDRLWYPDIVLRANQEGSFTSDEIIYGNSFHLLMAQVNKMEELEKKLNEFLTKGEIDRKYETKLLSETKGLLENPIYKAIIENSIEIRSEASILVGPNEIKRPDKLLFLADKIIVIDFKTGAKQAAHSKQINEYKLFLNEMFELPIDTYLYYSQENELVIFE